MMTRRLILRVVNIARRLTAISAFSKYVKILD